MYQSGNNTRGKDPFWNINGSDLDSSVSGNEIQKRTMTGEESGVLSGSESSKVDVQRPKTAAIHRTRSRSKKRRQSSRASRERKLSADITTTDSESRDGYSVISVEDNTIKREIKICGLPDDVDINNFVNQAFNEPLEGKSLTLTH